MDDMRSCPPKGAGQLIMTSDFISPFGRVRYCFLFIPIHCLSIYPTHFIAEWKTVLGIK